MQSTMLGTVSTKSGITTNYPSCMKAELKCQGQMACHEKLRILRDNKLNGLHYFYFGASKSNEDMPPCHFAMKSEDED